MRENIGTVVKMWTRDICRVVKSTFQNYASFTSLLAFFFFLPIPFIKRTPCKFQSLNHRVSLASLKRCFTHPLLSYLLLDPNPENWWRRSDFVMRKGNS
jgi:hypothetical protein